jgi:hypothetical protein
MNPRHSIKNIHFANRNIWHSYNGILHSNSPLQLSSKNVVVKQKDQDKSILSWPKTNPRHLGPGFFPELP